MIRNTLASDVEAAHDGDPASKAYDEIIFCYPGLEAITIYRLAHELHRLGVPLIPRMLLIRSSRPALTWRRLIGWPVSITWKKASITTSP